MIFLFVTFCFFIVISCLFKVLLKNFVSYIVQVNVFYAPWNVSSVRLSEILRDIRDTPYLPVFSPNPGKCEPEQLLIQTLFPQCYQCNAFIFIPTELLRRVARNFWNEGRFLKIKAQNLNRCERLNYIQRIQCASLINNYLNQMQIIFADIQARAWNFIKKRIPKGFNIFTRKNKRFFSSCTIYWASVSIDHQTVKVSFDG